MKTYKNTDLGFEIDIPDGWSYPVTLSPNCVLINSAPAATVNVVVGPDEPERLLEYKEFEFKQYAEQKKYTDLEFGRIHIGEREHVWACYYMPPRIYTKKYMIVFGGIEYAITATCSNESTIIEAEKIWDTVVQTFRLSEWRQKDLAAIDALRGDIAGELYVKGYEAARRGNYGEACSFLRECLDDDPDHILAHKELAFILKNMGGVSSALLHRQRVKELDPSDKVNCFNLAGIYAILGEKEEALREMDELIEKEPGNPKFREFKRKIANYQA